MNKRIYQEKESGYALVENMIVMPIVFLVLFALLFAGCILHAKCTIESAAKRGVIYATKLICDPQYEKITENAIDTSKGELNELSSEDYNFSAIGHYQPYRYILSFKNDSIETKAKDYVQRIISQNTTWMFHIDTNSIECKAENFVLTQNVKIKVTASYYTPKIFHYLGIPETYDLVAQAVMTVSDQDEFIRNVDFAADLVKDIAEERKIAEKISQPIEKLMNFVNKIFKK